MSAKNVLHGAKICVILMAEERMYKVGQFTVLLGGIRNEKEDHHNQP